MEKEGNNIVDFPTRNFPKGAFRTSGTLLLTVLLCLPVFISLIIQPVKANPGIGYWIVIAGTSYGDKQGEIDYGCNEVFRTLIKKGYTKDRVYYLNPHFQDVDSDGIDDRDKWASANNLQYAIQTWASARVSSSEPLFLYMFDHGGYEVFCIENSTGYFSVSSNNLMTWLNSLPSNVGKHVVYAACHSGSFINELSATGRVIITTSKDSENSHLGPDGHWEVFSQSFWPRIELGYSMLRAFNYASAFTKIAASTATPVYAQTPLLDDNGDGTGHTDPLPASGDGGLADTTFIGSGGILRPLRIRRAIPRQFYPWPPFRVSAINFTEIWAEVTGTNIEKVMAWMKPPDWSPPPVNNFTLAPLGFEGFEMTAPNLDGNYSARISAQVFALHGMGLYSFFITAQNSYGEKAIPLITGVQFTETGEPPPDNTNPMVEIERPIEDALVSGIIHITGTASDDVCLDKVELYINKKYTSTIILSGTSNSFFDFTFNASTLQGSSATFAVKPFDTSGNTGWESITVKLPYSIGGIVIPVDKLGLLAPYTCIVSTIAVATVATTAVIYVQRRKKKQ